MTSEPPQPDLSPPKKAAQSLSSRFNRTEHVISKTIEYLSIPSVVGFEAGFTRFLHKDFMELGLNVNRFPGLLEVSGSNPHSAILCAHIDRHGLISLGNGEYAYAAQYIKEIKYGEQNQSSVDELESIIERFVGEKVFAYDPISLKTLGKGKINRAMKPVARGDSIFYIENMANPGPDIPIGYTHSARVEHGLLQGQIDNALCVAMVYALFRAGYQGTAYLSTEEEIGKSWIHIANHLDAFDISSKDILVLDTSPYPSEAPLDSGTIVLRNRDRFGAFNTDLTDALKQRCEALGYTYQCKDEYLKQLGKSDNELGSTELGRLIQSKNGLWSGTTVQIPTNMYHTSRETTSDLAIERYFNFMRNILIDDPLPFVIEASDREE